MIQWPPTHTVSMLEHYNEVDALLRATKVVRYKVAVSADLYAQIFPLAGVRVDLVTIEDTMPDQIPKLVAIVSKAGADHPNAQLVKQGFAANAWVEKEGSEIFSSSGELAQKFSMWWRPFSN